MKQGALLRHTIIITSTTTTTTTTSTILCGSAKVELLLQSGGAAEAVGEDLHGAVVEVCSLGVVGEGD